MAGRQQTQLDFRGADADASVAWRYQMDRLREALSAIEPATVGLSDRAWRNVRELIMATRSYELHGRQPAVWELLKTSGLSDRQWKAARQSALRLRLIRAVRGYRGTRRLPDSLAVAIDVILALAKKPTPAARGPNPQPPPACPQGGCSPSAARLQPVRSHTVNPRAPAGAAKEFPISNTTTTSAGARAESASIARGTGEQAVEVEVLIDDCERLFGDACPERIGPAIRAALANGCTIAQLRARCRWFLKHQTRWPVEHRPGTIHDGIKYATAGMSDSRGWPYR